MPTDRERRPWWASLLGLFLAAEAAEGQEPVPAPPAPPAQAPPRRIGPIRRAIRHVGRTVHEDFIGDPDLFAEPPLGASLYGTIAVMRAKAEPHVYTLYRSDFLVDAPALTPVGIGRMDRINRTLRGWCGPVIIEPTPDKPGLAESRRDAVIAALQQGGNPVGPERVVIGPPVAPGLLGTDAGNNYATLITRDQKAPASFSVTPAMSTSPGGGGSGSSVGP
jgi:hypothetical protein